MIFKSSQRTGARSLANHLMNSRDNEEVQFSAMRGLVADDVHGALSDIEDFSLVSACQKQFYHVSLNPDRPLKNQDWQQAWTLYEIEFGLREQPFIEVTHRKEARLHKHRVYARVTEAGTALQLSFTRIRNEKIARILEYELGHSLTPGKHNRAVINRLREEGLSDVAQWMEQGHAHRQPRPIADVNSQDQQQEKRTKIPLAQIKADLQTIYQETHNGSTFEAALIAQGYLLARGDRRDLVIIDSAGGIHSPRRRLEVKAKDLKEKWADLNHEYLPTVEQVKQERNAQYLAQSLIKDKDPKSALKALEEKRQEIAAEIALLESQDKTELLETGSSSITSSIQAAVPETEDSIIEANIEVELPSIDPSKTDKLTVFEELEWALELTEYDRCELAELIEEWEENNPQNTQIDKEDTQKTEDISNTEKFIQKNTPETQSEPQKQPSVEKPQQSSSPTDKTPKSDQRDLIETYLPYYTERERRRLSAERDIAATESDTLISYLATTRAILSLTGKQAEAERDRRLQAAETAANRSAETQDRRSLTTYLTGLGQRLKEKGRSAYQKADLYLAERLTKLNYSQSAIRHALLRGSPALMEQTSSQRRSYLEGLVARVYHRFQRQKSMMEASRAVKNTMDKKLDNKDSGKEQSPKKNFHDPPLEEVDLPINAAGISKSLLKGGIKKSFQRLFGKGDKPDSSQGKPSKSAQKSQKEKATTPEREVRQQGSPKRRDEISQVQQRLTKQAQEKSQQQQQKRYQQTTRDVLEQGKSTARKPSGEDRPQQQFQKNTESVLEVSKQKQEAARQKQVTQDKASWLKHPEAARRLSLISKAKSSLRDQSLESLTSSERYQKLFNSKEFRQEFQPEQQASREADKWITKTLITQSLKESARSEKNAQETGLDLLTVHKAVANNSPGAGRSVDSYQYAGKIFQESWKEMFQPIQQEKSERSLATVYQAYHTAQQTHTMPPPTPDRGR